MVRPWRASVNPGGAGRSFRPLLAHADSINVYSGPTQSMSVVASPTDAKYGVSIMAFAPSATQIALREQEVLVSFHTAVATLEGLTGIPVGLTFARQQ